MIRHSLIATMTVGCLMLAAPVRAQGYIAGSLGSAFGGDLPSSKATYGVALGATSQGIVGIEFEFGHTPAFFSDGADSGGLMTLMGSLVVGLPLGPIRPYAAVGGGLIRQHVERTFRGLLTDFTSRDFGYGLGGGAEFTVVPHVAVRGDLRYMRVNETDGLRFGRFLVGIVLKS